MNIWFKSSNQKNKYGLSTSRASSFNSELPTITEDHRPNEDLDENQSSIANKSPYQFYNQSPYLPYIPFQPYQTSTSNSHKESSLLNQTNTQMTDTNLTKTNKSVRFNIQYELTKSIPNHRQLQRTNSITGTGSSHYGALLEKTDDDEQIDESPFMDLKYIKTHIRNHSQLKKKDPSQKMPSQLNKQVSSSSEITPTTSFKNSSNRKNAFHEQLQSGSVQPKTGRSINSMSVNYLFTEQRGQEWNMTNRSIEKSVMRTTGRKQATKEHIISIIEYCSNEVGMAIYNTTNGEIFLCQIIERLTYFRTLSTIERFYPLQLIYSSSLEHTPLIKKIGEKFKSTTFRNFRRITFDETKGFHIYNQRGNKEEYNPDNKFIAYSALSALMTYLESSYETKFNYSTLKMRWHVLQDLLIIESQTISSLEIFLNGETKQKSDCFINNFTCFTFGGTRMLRANLLQPLSNEQMIRNRQDLVQAFLDDKMLYDIVCSQVEKFKTFQIVTAKFIQVPKQKNIKSLKSYVAAIYSISNMCVLLKNFHKKIQIYISKSLPLISKLFSLIDDVKITQLRHDIQSNFDEEVLKSYDNSKGNKKDNFIFLFKMEIMEDEFIEVMRITYSHTLEDILQSFKSIKSKSGAEMKLLYSEFRGYYIKCSKKLNLSELAAKVEDDIIKISQTKDFINISTSILVSLNNRLKESEKKLILLSEALLLSIIEDIQKNIDILFDINYQMSVIDMVLSFVGFIKKYSMVSFCRPILQNNCNEFLLNGLKTVWTNQSKCSVSSPISISSLQNKKIMVYQKQADSFEQLNILYSIGYLTILSQVGCFVPASSFKTDIYHTLLSKIHLSESIETNLSHFQVELYHCKNVLENVLHKNTKCLMLFDQLIKGTQYEEEISLSLGLINQLAQVSGKSFILLSDLFQISLIENLDKSKNESQVQDAYGQLYFSSIQIERTQKQRSIEQLMNNLNFSDQFISHFNRLSLHKPNQRQFT